MVPNRQIWWGPVKFHCEMMGWLLENIRFSWAKSTGDGWVLMLTLLWKKMEGREGKNPTKQTQIKVRKKEGLCQPPFLPVSLVEDHEPARRKGTRTEGERGGDHTFKMYRVSAVASTTFNATDTQSTLRKSNTIKSCS